MRNEVVKKIIGFIGRRYGGRPFKVLRKFCYDTYDFMHQLPEVYYLIRKRFKPGSQNDRYCKDHYRGEDIILSRTGIVCICDGTLYHGGPTDRLRGILTTYDEARKGTYRFTYPGHRLSILRNILCRPVLIGG